MLSIQSTSHSEELEYYNFVPTYKFEDGFQVSHLGLLDSLNIVCAGTNIINNELPPNRIFNNFIYKSTNSGNNWSKIYTDTNEKVKSSDRFNLNIREIIYFDNNNISMFYDNGYVTRTEDGGDTWVLDSFGLNKYPYKTKFYDSNFGIVVWDHSIVDLRDEQEIYITENSGQSWDRIYIPYDTLFKGEHYYTINDISYLDRDLIYFSVDYSIRKNDTINDYYYYLVKYDLKTETWSKILYSLRENKHYREYDFNDTLARSIDFISKNVGYAFLYTLSDVKFGFGGVPWTYPLLQQTTDGGLTWKTLFHDKDTVRFSTTPSKVEVEYDNKFLLTNQSRNIIYKLEPNAEKFKTIAAKNISDIVSINKFKSTKDFLLLTKNKVIITGSTNYLFEVDLSNPITSVEDGNWASDLLLYPNPLPKEKELSIQFTPKIIGDALVRVIGMDGKEHYRFSEYFSTISNEIVLNKNLQVPSGVYMIEILYSNGHSESQSVAIE